MSAKKRPTTEDLNSRRKSGGKAGDRVRERLAMLLAERCGGVKSKLAQRLAVDKSRIREWLEGDALPGAMSLRNIGEQFGVSVDWLLGFDDVEPVRGTRGKIGVLAEELKAELVRLHPRAVTVDALARQHGLEPVLPDVDDPQFARQAISAWCVARYSGRLGLAADRIGRLAEHIRHDAKLKAHASWSRQMTDLADRMADRARRPLGFNDILSSKTREYYPDTIVTEGTLELELGWEIPVLAEGKLFTGYTPFRVPYGVGFAYRGSTAGHAWFLDSRTFEPVHKSGRRFLAARRD